MKTILILKRKKMNKSGYNDAFAEGLGVELKDINEDLEFNSIEEWDSIGHMGLIAALEESLDISFETDDIVEYSSYKKGIEILKKYNVEIE
jgi:acyl carrier protein